MNLDEAQKQRVAAWIKNGLTLSEIQDKLTSELGIRLTYLETRFLVDDLGLRPADKAPATPMPSAATPPPPDELGSMVEAGDETAAEPVETVPDAALGVTVTVDQVAQAGAVVSGKVTFSDGNAAQWYLDQSGRLGLSPSRQGYRPSQEDLVEFQTALQSELAKLGY